MALAARLSVVDGSKTVSSDLLHLLEDLAIGGVLLVVGICVGLDGDVVETGGGSCELRVTRLAFAPVCVLRSEENTHKGEQDDYC